MIGALAAAALLQMDGVAGEMPWGIFRVFYLKIPKLLWLCAHPWHCLQTLDTGALCARAAI